MNFLTRFLEGFRWKSRCHELERELDLYKLRCGHLESELKELKQESDSYKKQALGLREWIRHVHHLDSVPVSRTIRDILTKARS